MTNRRGLLAVILVVQFVLFGAVTFIDSVDDQTNSFLEVKVDRITGIRVSDAEENVVELSLGDQGWQFSNGISADAGKVTGVLEKLSNTGSIWPVAVSASSQERFEVTQDKFQRRVELSIDGELVVDLFLGTSPGFRRVHARHVESDEVYSIDFGNHEVPALPDDWLDKTLLGSTGVKSISLADDWTLSKSDSGWLLDDGEADAAAAQRLADRIQNLRVMGFFSGDEQTLAEPRIVAIEDDLGTNRLTFRHDEQADEYVVSADRTDGAYTVASYIAEQVLVAADTLVSASDEGDSEDEETDTPPS